MTLDDSLIAADCQSDSLESVTDTPLPFSEPSGRRCATNSCDEMVNCLCIGLGERHRWRCQSDARITSWSWHLVILIHSTLLHEDEPVKALSSVESFLPTLPALCV